MKLKSTLFLLITLFALSSCSSRVNFAEDLAIPVIQGLKNDNRSKLAAYLPGDDVIGEVFAANPGAVGFVNYNKYSRSYRGEALRAHLFSNMELIENLSREKDLNWNGVQYSAPTKEDKVGGTTNYSVLTSHLKFPNGQKYILQYTATRAKGQWFLLGDVYMTLDTGK